MQDFNYKVIYKIEDLPNFDVKQPLFFDVETQDLYTYIRLIQVYQPQTSNTVYILDMDSIPLQEALYELKPMYLVGYNLSYDFATIGANLGHNYWLSDKSADLFYAAKTSYAENQEFALNQVLSYIGLDNLYEGLDKKKLQKSGFVKGAYLSQQQLKYSALDVYALNILWSKAKIQQAMSTTAWNLDNISQREWLRWQCNGLPVMRDKWLKYTAINDQKIIDTMAQLPKDLNPRSPKQVTELFGTDSSDRPTLMRLAINEGNKIAEHVLSARQALNDRSKLARYTHPKMYGFFNANGTTTGRSNCKGSKQLPETTNLQNYPRSFKGVFGVEPDSDLIIIAADYATAELRAAASIYKDKNMYAALKRGDDLHKYTASIIYNVPIDQVDGRMRSNAKPCNFGFCFGLSAKAFVGYAFDLYGLRFTDDEAQELKNKWFSAYPDIGQYHKNVWKKMKHGKYIVQTALGRRICPKLGTDGINAPVQGTIGETMKLAIHYMTKENPEVLDYIVNSIHDSVYLIAPEKDAKYWGNLVERNMILAWQAISKTAIMHYKDIPISVDIVYGKNMVDLADEFEGGGMSLNLDEMKDQLDKNAEIRKHNEGAK